MVIFLRNQRNLKVSVAGFFLDVPAKLETHGGKQFGREVVFAARGEALIESGGENRGGGGGLDRRKDGPAAFAGVGDAPGVAIELGLFEERDGGEVEEPGGDDTAAAPNLSDVGEIQIVLVML